MLAIGLILYFIFINPKRRSKSVFCGECFEKVNGERKINFLLKKGRFLRN